VDLRKAFPDSWPLSAMPQPPNSAADAVKPTVGKGWEAWVQNDWHGVEVIRVMRDTCTIRWDWDGSQDEIWNSYVRPAPSAAKKSEVTAKTAETPAALAGASSAAASMPVQASVARVAPAAPVATPVAAPAASPAAEEQSPFAVGALVEGRYGHEWFDAVVVGFEQHGAVRIKWDYDGSESSMPVSELRAKSPPPPQAPSPSRPATVEERARDAVLRQTPESRRSYDYPASAQPVQPAAAWTPEPRARDYTQPSPYDATKQAGRAWAQEEPAKVSVKPENIRRILELIPTDAPAEVRSYLQSLLPATAVY